MIKSDRKHIYNVNKGSVSNKLFFNILSKNPEKYKINTFELLLKNNNICFLSIKSVY